MNLVSPSDEGALKGLAWASNLETSDVPIFTTSVPCQSDQGPNKRAKVVHVGVRL